MDWNTALSDHEAEQSGDITDRIFVIAARAALVHMPPAHPATKRLQRKVRTLDGIYYASEISEWSTTQAWFQLRACGFSPARIARWEAGV